MDNEMALELLQELKELKAAIITLAHAEQSAMRKAARKEQGALTDRARQDGIQAAFIVKEDIEETLKLFNRYKKNLEEEDNPKSKTDS